MDKEDLISGPRPVLILAGTPRVVQAIARCLHRHGIVVDVAYPEALGPVNFTSRAVRQVYRLRDFGPTENFYRALDDLIEKNGYDTLIPTTDEALVAIAPIYGSLRQRLYPGCPAPEIVNSVLDKRITLRVADECGISIPREYQFRSLEALDRDRDVLRFPLLAKPASKVEEVNFALKYFNSFDQLRQAFLDEPSFGCGNLLQEYCPGFGVGIEALVWDGKIQVVFQHRRLKELPSTGGVSILCDAQLPDPQLVELAVRLLQRLNWQGAAMVEFRYDPATSKAVLMEVNGRYWGSLPLATNAGIEFPYYEWQLAHRQALAAVPSYRPGYRTLWRVGDMKRFISLIALWKSGKGTFRTLAYEGWALIRDGVSPTADALWQWSDPWPAVHEFTQFLKGILRPGILLRFLPAGIARQCVTYRYYGLRHGLRHTSLAVLYALHVRRRNVRPLLSNANSFLFVCSGNIVRSPLAAALLCQQWNGAGTRIESAGLFAQAGKPADPTAVAAARELGISLDQHRSAPLTAEMIERSDIIFVMDLLHEAVLLNRFPHAARKTFLLGVCSEGPGADTPKEILDPFGRGRVEILRCYGEVGRRIHTLSQWLRHEPT